MTKWEYKTVILTVHDPETFGEHLRVHYGQYGWELVSVGSVDQTAQGLEVLLVFKRPSTN